MNDKRVNKLRDSSHSLFNRISKRYDILNHLLSFGIDFYWRYQLARRLPKHHDLVIYDLATGTGDLAFSILKRRRRFIKRLVGIDPAVNMLALASKKQSQKRLPPFIEFIEGSATNIPFDAHSADVLTMSFGIRNISDFKVALADMNRVLKPDGDVFILEFAVPLNRVIKVIYLTYFRKILPFIGSLLSGDSDAYRYLNQTAESFPQREAFCSHIREAGFKDASWHSLTFGTVILYHAKGGTFR